MIKGLLFIFLGFILGVLATIIFLVAAVLTVRHDQESRMPTKEEWRQGL